MERERVVRMLGLVSATVPRDKLTETFVLLAADASPLYWFGDDYDTRCIMYSILSIVMFGVVSRDRLYTLLSRVQCWLLFLLRRMDGVIA